MQAERSAVGTRGPQRMDTAALNRTLSRLLRAGQAPWLHQEAARRMAERLPLIKLQPGVVLDWSGPQGASSSLLQAAYPRALQRAIAPADGEPARASTPRRWWDWKRHASVQAEPVRVQDLPVGQAELLWSNMMLQGCADPQPVFEQWQRAMAIGGFLMFSTWGPGSLPELRELYRARGWGEPMAPLVDMHDLGDMLVLSGFADPVMDQELLTLTWPDADALLRELRGLGANLSPQRHPGLRTPRWLDRLRHALCEHQLGGRPSLTFELVYGHAFRVAAKVRVQAQASVSLDEMRSMIRTPRV